MGSVLEHEIMRAAIVGIRISMLMVFAPFFANQAIPARLKAGLTIALTVMLYPVCIPRTFDFEGLNWGLAVVGEAVAGLILGLTLSFVFEGAAIAGQMLGFQLGYSLVNVIDPQTQVDTPVLAVFYQTLVLLLFLELGVHRWVLRGLVRSFEYLPPGTLRFTPAATEGLLHSAGAMLVIAVQIAAPALAVTLLADVILGLIGKASPQFPAMFIGMSVKALIGFLVMAVSLRYWPALMERYFTRGIQAAEHLLGLAR